MSPSVRRLLLAIAACAGGWSASGCNSAPEGPAADGPQIGPGKKYEDMGDVEKALYVKKGASAKARPRR